MLDGSTGVRQAGCRHSHNQIHARVVEVLHDRRNVGDFTVGVGFLDRQIAAFFKPHFLKAVEEPFHARFGARLRCKVGQSDFVLLPKGCMQSILGRNGLRRHAIVDACRINKNGGFSTKVGRHMPWIL